MSKTRYGHLVSSTSWFCPLKVMRYKLLAGFKSINGQVEILDSDSLCYLVKNYSKGAIGVRTISKSLLNEYVNYFEKHPDNNADQARKDLAGHTSVDKFEYGYSSTLTTMAKMVLGEQLSSADKLLSNEDAKTKSIDQPLQLIYYGAPGTGKSFTIDKATNENNSVRTTFHPDSDYASFVGAYKPTMAPMPVHAFVGTTVHHAKNSENKEAYEKKIVYKYVPQAFLKAYVEAWKRYSAGEDNPYYLVIEEINRGNCAQIFGDLFQLLDRNNTGCSSYAISADEDIAQFLREDDKGFSKLTEEQRMSIGGFKLKKDSGVEEEIGPEILNGSKLLLPPNLRIWATMNTSDQSLFPIDSAFKRRWNWEYMPIEYDKEEWYIRIGKTLYLWGDFLEVINPSILEITGSVDKQMGYYFTKPDTLDCDGKKNIISDKFFVNKVLFYLWSDVLKDYDLTTKPFMYEDENHRKVSFKFTDFFPVDENDMLELFMDGLELDSFIDESDDGDGNYSSLSVKWPDGDVMNEGKKYEVYVKALKKIGLQTAMENLRNRKRLGVPLISRTKDERIETHKQYRYVDEDGYYIIIGIDNYGSTLRYLSGILKLGLEVQGE